MKRQLVILGGGSAGLAAALSARAQGIQDLIILEREKELGGILQQCIHTGFGLQTFHQELTGPAYAQKLIDQVKLEKIEFQLESTVIKITQEKQIHILSPQFGVQEIEAKAIVLAMGCRERSAGEIGILGNRPAGVICAGSAQKYLNQQGYLVGKKVFILGSGDIGLIMARRMTLEGATVLGVAEIMPYSNGLPRNLKQCLEDFAIPLYLSHTVTKLFGKSRLEAIELCQVDQQLKPMRETAIKIEADTLLLSVGLIPENELSEDLGLTLDKKTKGILVDENRMSEIEGIFACGNVLHVHDLVDEVTKEATLAGASVAHYLKQTATIPKTTCVMQQRGELAYILPQRIHLPVSQQKVEFLFRVKRPISHALIHITAGKWHKEIKRNDLIPSIMQHLTLSKEEIELMDENVIWEVKECQ